MLKRPAWLLRSSTIGSLALTLCLTPSCGNTFTTAEGGSGGSDTGGSSSGGATTGGSSSGGATGGGHVVTTCSSHSNCLAVVDASHPCFTPDCGSPQAATVHEVASDECLLLWENRFDPVPDGCQDEEVDISCPADCAMPPECVWARCADSACTLDLGYSAAECAPSSECPELTQQLEDAIEEARACSAPVVDITDPTEEDSTACSSEPGVHDSCNCLTIVNASASDKIVAAQNAYDAWNDAQCTPAPNCDPCPDAKAGTCVRGDAALTGRCTAAAR